MIATLQTTDNYAWWASLKHGGLLIAPSKLAEFFQPESLAPLPFYTVDRLRRDVLRVQDGDEAHIGTLLDTVLEEVLGLAGDEWLKGNALDSSWAQRAMTRELIKPRRVWLDARGGVLPVFVADSKEQEGRVTRLGLGRGKRSLSRMLEWLRKANQKVALLTNGRQWRLIHAGSDYDAWCEWDIDFWFEEGVPGLQVTALRLLLGEQALRPAKPEEPSRLLGAIAASRQGQAELSEVLGERVRQAVELLIRESAEALAGLGVGNWESGIGNREAGIGRRESGGGNREAGIGRRESGGGNREAGGGEENDLRLTTPEPRHIYIAAVRMIMRCVVILFAEARDLLPRHNPIYHSSYGIQGLREQLDRMAGGRANERLRNGSSAWSRLLALFRLIYQGSAHEKLPVPRYAGGLFTPGDAASHDPILRALSAFENPTHPPSDAVVYRILELLCRSQVRVRQGRSSTWVEAPVDFSDLSSEYIGILYEGLLDFELRQAGENDPIVFLNLGDQPALPLTRLEGMEDKTLAALVEKLKQKAKEGEGESGSEESGVEEELDVEADDGEVDEAEDALLPTDDAPLPTDDLQDDQLQQLRDRAQRWAVKAVEVGKLVPKPRSKKADALATYEQAVSKTANGLIARVVLPGEWFLVRWGGTRKGSGTFYTRPQLAIPTVQRTLLPLAYRRVEKSGIGSRELGVGSRESGIGSWEAGIGSRESGTLGNTDSQLTTPDQHDASTNLQRPQGIERGDQISGDVLPGNEGVSEGRDIRVELADSTGSRVSASEYSRGLRTGESRRIYPISEDRPGIAQGTGDSSHHFRASQSGDVPGDRPNCGANRDSGEDAAIADSDVGREGTGVGNRGKFGNRESGEIRESVVGNRESDDSRLNDSPLPTPEEWIPKTPIAILNLKICDPACGSASFLLAALRFLSDALWQSLFYHGWLVERGDEIVVSIPLDAQPGWFAECVKDLPVTVEKAEERSKPRLKRLIVERCLYGVDINPLAVELARLSLWVETMDQYLPFGFLDHKIKCGNALVGCWFDRFQDYPAMAWEREGGDANHDRFVHHFREYVATRGKSKGQRLQSGDRWTQAIKDTKEMVKAELVNLIKALDPEWRRQMQLPAPDFDLPKPPEEIHQDAVNIFEELHQMAIADTQEQARCYREKVEQSEELRQLRRAFDTWCAVWFWPGEAIAQAPTPGRFFIQPDETVALVDQLTREYQFFHWELEFPDVFRGNYQVEGEESLGDESLVVRRQSFSSPIPDSQFPPHTSHGFDAIVGNPPWEIQKPNSKEFFSNVDPLYRTYGKQEALEKQLEYFENSPQVEQEWLAYCAKLKALSNWTKYVGYPFGINEAGEFHFSLSRGKENAILHQDWLAQQQTRSGYADPDHPFRYQGSADINTYKMFAELAHALLKTGGRFSLIIPSGIYTDKGTGQLRNLFLNQCEWTHLYALQNERFVFGNIHHSFKMVVLTINKAGQTDTIATRFRLGPGDSPEAQELETDILNDANYLSVPAQQIKRFSPNTGALLEIRTEQDLKILEKMYQNGVLLGDQSPQGWGIQYAREFDMTNDSKLFPPRPKWEEKGYRPDEYGHWLKGNWRDVREFGIDSGVGNRESGIGNRELLVGNRESGIGEESAPSSRLNDSRLNDSRSILHRPEGLVLSVDGKWAIAVDEVEDVALPLYEGRMVGQFDFSEKGWVSGTGRKAVWREISSIDKVLEPQFLMANSMFLESESPKGTKIGFLAISSASNTRSMICTNLYKSPCGNAVPTLEISDSYSKGLWLTGVFNSYFYDFTLRNRFGGVNLNFFVVEETPVVKPELFQSFSQIAVQIAGLCWNSSRFASAWLKIASEFARQHLWKQLWAATPHERLRLRCIIEAVVAELYGLSLDEGSWILKECDHPIKKVCDKPFSRTLEPKGFWRVDKEKDPELRHTVLSLIAFHELKQIGLEAFLNLNDGEGWMLPATLRLADYGLGHDDRAKDYQRVAARLGDRFLPWQLEGTPEESWAECDRHAENLRRLLGNPPHPLTPSPTGGEGEPETGSAPLSRSGRGVGGEGKFTPAKQLNLIEEETQQLGLFDTLEQQ